MLVRILAVAAVAVLVTGVAWADEGPKTLTIGDPAPTIDIGYWLKGHKVANFESGKVYVLEFWATWCGPCKASMPHISKLQKLYGDKVTVIGISDETLATVVKFLAANDAGKTWYDKIEYTLTTDPDESVKKDYHSAAGQQGIPSSFIVGKDGHVEWIGHPMSIDKPLAAVVEGTWERESFKKQWDDARAFDVAMMKVRGELGLAVQTQDWPTVLKIMDGLLAKFPDKLQLQLQRFNLLLVQMNKPGDAYAGAEKLLAAAWDNANALNGVAWTIADNPKVTKRDLDLAMKAAERANELTESKNAPILDTLARVFYEKGNLGKALEWQRKAAEHAGDAGNEQMAAEIRKVLEKYEAEAESTGK